MPRRLTEQECWELFREPHVAVLSVASDNARPPLTAPVWYAPQDDGTVFFFTGSTGEPVRKTRLIRKAGVLSLVVQREQLPYRYATLEGSVTAYHQPPSRELLLSVVSRYLPDEPAQGFVEGLLSRVTPHLIGFSIRPDHWDALDFSE